MGKSLNGLTTPDKVKSGIEREFRRKSVDVLEQTQQTHEGDDTNDMEALTDHTPPGHSTIRKSIPLRQPMNKKSVGLESFSYFRLHTYFRPDLGPTSPFRVRYLRRPGRAIWLWSNIPTASCENPSP